MKTWTRSELLWLFSATITITALSLYWGDTLMGIISAVTGVLCVICTAKGSLWAYIWGAINTLLYAIISWQAGFLGEVTLNAFYYFPLQFYGFYVWHKHMNIETGEVEKRKMSGKNLSLMLIGTFVGTLIFGFILYMLNGNLPFVDALSTVVSVVAMIVSIKRYAEQWLLWIIVDVVTVGMWGYAFFVQGSESVATLMMWMVYLLNAIFAYIKWMRESNVNENHHEKELAKNV